MEPVGILLVMVIIMAILGTILYSIVDLSKHKRKVDEAIMLNSKEAAQWKQTNDANLKYVVEQVNKANDAVYNTYTTAITPIQSSMCNIQRTLNANGSNVMLMKNGVSTTGMTFENIGVGKGQVSLCGAGVNSSRCSKFPGPSGDIEIKAFDATKNVQFGSPVNMPYGGISMNGIGVGDAMTNIAFLSNAYLTVKTNTQPKTNMMTIDSGVDRVMEINAGGVTSFNKPLRFNAKEGLSFMNGAMEASRIQYNTTENATVISGDVDIPGLRVNGKTLTVEDVDKLKAIDIYDIEKLRSIPSSNIDAVSASTAASSMERAFAEKSVSMAPPPVNCVVSDWSQWTTCSKSCGGGTQTRNRTIEVPAANGGTACPTEMSQTQVCNAHVCPVNCEVTEWGQWSTCSKPCGGGTQTRTRTVKTPAANGGTACPTDLSQTQVCNSQACPVCSTIPLLQDLPDRTRIWHTDGNGTPRWHGVYLKNKGVGIFAGSSRYSMYPPSFKNFESNPGFTNAITARGSSAFSNMENCPIFTIE